MKKGPLDGVKWSVIRKSVFIVSLLLAPTLLANAEVLYTYPPSHNCLRPIKPFMFASQQERTQYREDIEEYMNCLKQFVEEQNEEIRKHQEAIQRHKEAAEAAIEEWKEFVNELKRVGSERGE
jgi:hypothetical protein